MQISFISRYGWVALLLVGFVGSGCAPEIGDACGTALDCSASGTRLCDLTQPRGYCTLDGCEANTCPDEAVCVQFGRRIGSEPVDRLSRTYCMYKCDSGNDCRSDEGYACFSSKTFGAPNQAQVLGPSEQQFCAPLAPVQTKDAGPKDAGSKDAGPEDDAGASS